jgi:hypothetical protein
MPRPLAQVGSNRSPNGRIKRRGEQEERNTDKQDHQSLHIL